MMMLFRKKKAKPFTSLINCYFIYGQEIVVLVLDTAHHEHNITFIGNKFLRSSSSLDFLKKRWDRLYIYIINNFDI